jgi:hypothetical protein
LADENSISGAKAAATTEALAISRATVVMSNLVAQRYPDHHCNGINSINNSSKNSKTNINRSYVRTSAAKIATSEAATSSCIELGSTQRRERRKGQKCV